jgi:hypothetical protein
MEPMNREQRRHPERQPGAGAPPAKGGPQETPPASGDEQMRGADRNQDDLSVRAKNSGHGKKTADKWNQ